MPESRRIDVRGLRGWGRLAFDATRALTTVVEGMHHEIARAPPVFAAPRLGPTRGVTGLVYRSIREGSELLGRAYDAALAQLEPASAERALTPVSETVRAALNGVVGDHLVATCNPLAIAMRLRQGGRALPLEPRALAAAARQARPHVVVLIHGLCMSDLGWARDGHDHGAALARDLDCTAVYLHYNTGLHISTNGRGLADLLEKLVLAWPVEVERLTLIGHSMGGLVARSACHQAERAGAAWRRRLADLVCLGTPHLGAPLARGIHWIHAGLGVSPYTAALALLGKVWSAGATDLRHAYLLEEDWLGRDGFPVLEKATPVPVPAGVQCFAIAGCKERVAGALLGDGLVPVASALGRDGDPRRALDLAETRRWIARGVDHFGLLGERGVYERLRSWLSVPGATRGEA